MEIRTNCARIFRLGITVAGLLLGGALQAQNPPADPPPPPPASAPLPPPRRPHLPLLPMRARTLAITM